MKKVLLSVLAVGMLTACSQDETISMQSPTQIAFEGAFVNKATRAVDAADPSTTTSSINTFDVWGYVQKSKGTVFDDVTVTKNGNAWTYSPLQYWAPGQTYHFFALTPDNSETVKKTLSTDPYKEGLGSIQFTNNYGTEDILYATASATTEKEIQDSYEKVKFAFDHLLAKVKFTFKNGFATGYSTIEVTNVKITNAPNQGSVTLGVEQADQAAGENYEWTIEGTETTELEFGDASGDKTVGEGEEKTTIGIAEGAKFESDNERLTIPAAADQVYNVTFTVKLYQDQALVLTVPKEVKITGIELVSGHAYNFVATLDPSNTGDKALKPIEFEAVVDEWIEAGDYGFHGVTNVANEEDLTAAIAAGGDIILTSDIALTKTLAVDKDVTLNLNGKKLSINNESDELGIGDGIIATAGNLVIEGEGTVEANTRAIWARGDGGAKITINGGTYIGAKGNTEVIYASGNGKITINGGTFEAKSKSTGFTPDQYAVLNLQDKKPCDIIVYGGSFKDFDPSDNVSENPKKNFVAPGYKSVANGEYFDVVAE